MVSYPRSISIPLKYCTYEVWPDSRSVRTVFPDGLSCGAMRDESDPNNIREAREGEGYTGPDAVWRSLVDHELLHSLVAEAVLDRSSVVLREQAGDQTFTPAWEKYEEESLVLAYQLFFNTGIECRPLVYPVTGVIPGRLILSKFKAIKDQHGDIYG